MDSARLNKQRWGDRLQLGDPRDSEHFCMAVAPSLSFMTVRESRAVVLPQYHLGICQKSKF